MTIEVQTNFDTRTGTSGAGLCASGTTTDVTNASGFQSGNHTLFLDLKTFTCADGSGTFTANVQAHAPADAPGDAFTWNILSGTGAYVNLHATGSGSGDSVPAGTSDHFVGAVHFGAGHSNPDWVETCRLFPRRRESGIA